MGASHAGLCRVHARRQTDHAVEEYERAVNLNPNFAAAHGYLGWALASAVNQTGQAITAETAIRISTHDPQNVIFNNGLAVAHYLAGQYVEAVGFARKSVQQRDGMMSGHRIYVASLAQAGQIEEARAELARLQELHPENSIAWVEQNIPLYPRPDGETPRRLAQGGDAIIPKISVA